MPHPPRTAVVGLLVALCAVVVAALGAERSAVVPVVSAQTDPIATSLSTSGGIDLAFADQSDGRFPPGVRGIQLELDADLEVEQRLSGDGAAMSLPVLHLVLEGEGVRFDDNLGSDTERTIGLTLNDVDRSCQSNDGWSCSLMIESDDLALPALKIKPDASGATTVRATLSDFGLYRTDQPSAPIQAAELEELSFSAAVTLNVGTTERVDDPRLYLSFSNDSDGHFAAGFGSDGAGGAPIELELEFSFAQRQSETVSNLEARLEAYGRVEIPSLLGSQGLEIEKSGLGGLSTGSCQLASARSHRWRCALSGYQARALLPQNLPDGVYRISGHARLLGLRLSYEVNEAGTTYAETAHWDEFDTTAGTRSLTISEQREIAVLSLGLIEGEPAVVPAHGGQTRLRLSILNANGDPSHPIQIGVIIITTSSGSLELVNGGACETSCTLSDEFIQALEPKETGALDFILTAGPAGAAVLEATVALLDGGPLLRAEPLQIDFSGTVARLALDAPDGTLHHVKGANPVKVKIIAHDERGVPATPDHLELTIVGPNAQVIGADQIIVRQQGDEITLTTQADEGNSLTPSLYILRAHAGSFSAARIFTVSGPPAEVAFTVDPRIASQVGQIVSVSAVLTDARSQPVANGLPVRIESLNDRVLLGVGPQNVTTEDGRASRWFGVGRGGEAVVVLSADGDNLVSTKLVASHAARQEGGNPLISDEAPDGRAVWLGYGGRASLLIPLLRSTGVFGLWAWIDDEWSGYALDERGQAAPGSTDFEIETGDTLYPIP